MQKRLIIDYKKIIMVYSLGFISAFLIPEKHFFGMMNILHKKINEDLIVLDKEEYYKLI